MLNAQKGRALKFVVFHEMFLPLVIALVLSAFPVEHWSV